MMGCRLVMGMVAALAAMSCYTSTAAAQEEAYFTPDVLAVSNYSTIRSHGKSHLYQFGGKDAGSIYEHAPYIIDLHGSRQEMGTAYGYMLADEISEAYHTLTAALIGDKWYDDAIVAILGDALDWQWNDYLSQQLPQDFKDELAGIENGGILKGKPGIGALVQRIIVLANAPGDAGDFVYILMREFLGDKFADIFGDYVPDERPNGMCSMIATWGSRTQDKKLFAGRNLDWNQNTGVNKFKLITVFHPEGKIAHAIVSFIGLYGAIAGMSNAGITVHEANLEENEISFVGFPWLLRLRYIMENAATCEDALTLWKATNNTVGFNHMVSCAADAAAIAKGSYTGPGPAQAMETMYQYTAFFTANDTREAAAIYQKNSTTPAVHIGAPMPEAVWRTNHGYDPTIRQHYEWSQAPTSWSVERYFFIHDAIKEYEATGKPIGMMEMANITAIVGDKGKDPYRCQTTPDGSNVISVAYAPTDMQMGVAWESGSGDGWQPACCSTYLVLDMKTWFEASPTV